MDYIYVNWSINIQCLKIHSFPVAHVHNFSFPKYNSKKVVQKKCYSIFKSLGTQGLCWQVEQIKICTLKKLKIFCAYFCLEELHQERLEFIITSPEDAYKFFIPGMEKQPVVNYKEYQGWLVQWFSTSSPKWSDPC